MLIFYINTHFERHTLSTRMTLYPISRQVIALGLESGGRWSPVRVTRVVAYVQLLNPSPEPKNWYAVLEVMIGMGEAVRAGKKGEDISKKPLFRWLYSWDLEGKVTRHLVPKVSILIKFIAILS